MKTIKRLYDLLGLLVFVHTQETFTMIQSQPPNRSWTG